MTRPWEGGKGREGREGGREGRERGREGRERGREGRERGGGREGGREGREDKLSNANHNHPSPRERLDSLWLNLGPVSHNYTLFLTGEGSKGIFACCMDT
jgi:hypothetical protein